MQDIFLLSCSVVDFNSMQIYCITTFSSVYGQLSFIKRNLHLQDCHCESVCTFYQLHYFSGIIVSIKSSRRVFKI